MTIPPQNTRALFKAPLIDLERGKPMLTRNRPRQKTFGRKAPPLSVEDECAEILNYHARKAKKRGDFDTVKRLENQMRRNFSTQKEDV